MRAYINNTCEHYNFENLKRVYLKRNKYYFGLYNPLQKHERWLYVYTNLN